MRQRDVAARRPGAVAGGKRVKALAGPALESVELFAEAVECGVVNVSGFSDV